MSNDKDDDRYPTDDDEDAEGLRRTSEGSAFSFEHVEICPLEAQCNPSLDGRFDKAAVLARVADLSANELANISELCMCVKGCKYRKCVDSDAAWWPHCAATWYEPGMVGDRGLARRASCQWRDELLMVYAFARTYKKNNNQQALRPCRAVADLDNPT